MRNVVPRQGTETFKLNDNNNEVEETLRNVVPRQGTETIDNRIYIYTDLLRNVVPRQGTETSSRGNSNTGG